MAPELLVELSLVLSIATGSIAVTLCVLAWDILQRTTVGRAIASLAVAMWLFSVYHAIELLIPGFELFTGALKSLTYTVVAMFVLLWIRVDLDVAPGEP